MEIGGAVEPGFEGVAEAFQACFEQHGEVGAATSVYVGGRKVVDLWGGVADRDTGNVGDGILRAGRPREGQSEVARAHPCHPVSPVPPLGSPPPASASQGGSVPVKSGSRSGAAAANASTSRQAASAATSRG